VTFTSFCPYFIYHKLPATNSKNKLESSYDLNVDAEHFVHQLYVLIKN